MTDLADGSFSIRRSRLRRMALIITLLLVGIVVWRTAAKHSVINRARQIKIGQHHEEVLKAMGEAQFTYQANGAWGESYSDMPALEVTLRVWIQNAFGVGAFPDLDQFTVRIQYDED